MAIEDAAKIRKLISNDKGKAALAKILEAGEEDQVNMEPDNQQKRMAFLAWKELTEAERKTLQTVMEDAGFPDAADNMQMDLNMLLPAY
jgi:hypothetical protein